MASTSPSFAPGQLDGTPPGERAHEPLLDGTLQRIGQAVCDIFPANFAGVPIAAVTRSVDLEVDSRVATVRRRDAIRRVQPQFRPSGGFTEPPLSDRSWYPLYEVLSTRVPADPRPRLQSARVHHRLPLPGCRHDGVSATADVGRVQDFSRFIIVPHGGGAVPYHWGRFAASFKISVCHRSTS